MGNEDFNHEIEATNFYFKETALKIDGFKGILLEQFKDLPLVAKYNLYCKDVPNHAEIVKAFHSSKSVNSETEAETQLNEIWYKFNELARSKKLEDKYLGHYLTNAPLIKTLQQIEAKIQEFEKYISKKVTRDNDVSFAAAFTNKLILLTDKLGFPILKAAIINEFVNESENFDINTQDIMNLIDGASNADSRHLKSDYGNLKDYADSELLKHLKVSSNLILNTNGLTLWDLFFDESKAEQIKKNLIIENRLDQNLLTFMPQTKGSKFEPGSLVAALKKLTYIPQIEPDEMIKILERTFTNYSSDLKTFRKGLNHEKADYYKALCKLG